MTIIHDRLSLLDTIHLGHGSHKSREDGFCVMELAGYLAGEPWGDSPQCASPVITSLMIGLNDRWTDDHRQLLKSLIPLVIGTRTSDQDETTRRLMIRDWLVHDHSPRLFRHFGYDDLAARFEALPRITTSEEWESARAVIREVRDEAWERRRKARRRAAATAAATAAAAADAATAAVAVAAAAADADADADVYKEAVAEANKHTDYYWDRYQAAFKVLRPHYDQLFHEAYGEVGDESRRSVITLVERLCEVGR